MFLLRNGVSITNYSTRAKVSHLYIENTPSAVEYWYFLEWWTLLKEAKENPGLLRGTIRLSD